VIAAAPAAPPVASLQRETGAFDDDQNEALVLVALRALDAARTMG
jgi:hypothetical protein